MISETCPASEMHSSAMVRTAKYALDTCPGMNVSPSSSECMLPSLAIPKQAQIDKEKLAPRTWRRCWKILLLYTKQLLTVISTYWQLKGLVGNQYLLTTRAA